MQKQIQEQLQKLNFKISHWGLVGKTLELEQIEENKFFLNVFESENLVYNYSPNFSFQLHFDPVERLIALFVKSNDRGWYLETLDIWEVEDIKLLIIKMFKNRENMMKEIYERFLNEA